MVIRKLVSLLFRNQDQYGIPKTYIFDFIRILLTNKKPLYIRRVLMWALRDLNPGQTDYESAALTN